MKTFGQFTGIDDDNVFGDNGGVDQTATVTGDVTTGFLVTLDVGVDPTTAQTMSAAPGGGGAGGPGGGGPPPSGGLGSPPPTGSPGSGG